MSSGAVSVRICITSAFRPTGRRTGHQSSPLLKVAADVMFVGYRAGDYSTVVGRFTACTRATGHVDPFHFRNEHPSLSLFEVGQVVRFSERRKVLLHTHSQRINLIGHAFDCRPVPAKRRRVDAQWLDDLEVIPDDQEVGEDIQIHAGSWTHIEETFRLRITVALAQRGFEGFHSRKRPDPLPVSIAHPGPLIQYGMPISE